MLFNVLDLNPPAVAVRLYSPGCRNGTLNSPLVLVVVVRVSPVLSCLTATCALGIRAPEGSSTDPDIVPVEICPNAGQVVSIERANDAKADLIIADMAV